MSDDEDLGSVEDFSASEDEWKPGKVHRQDTDESDDDDSDFEDDAATKKRDGKSQVKTAIKSDRAVKQTKKRKPNGSSLRTKLYNKYKPPPKTIRNQSTTPSRSIRQNQSRSTAQTAKGASPDGRKVEASDSDSSGDDYLVNPNEIDLKSSFFDVKPSTSGEIVERNAPPQFDCNAGMQLTDSEDNDGNDHDDDDDDDDDDDTDSIGGAAKQSGNKEKPVDLGYLQNYAANMKKAEVLYKKQKELSLVAADAKVDVSSLLAMGESTSANSKAPIKSTKSVKRLTKKTQSSQSANAAAVAADTDSDWEEVEDENHIIAETQTANTLANGIQVCIDLPQNRRKDKKAIDAEASLKRQLNRIIKENQIFLHKVGLLCHIHHGLFINKAANNIHLMPIALKLLPSKNVYPSGQTEIKYFQSMVTWYKTTIKLVDNRMYPKIRIDPVISLAVQLKNRHAVCKRDFVLMFVILLRAMGMQCRLVVNMVPAPLRPPQSALCSLKMKPVDDGKDKDSATVKKERFRYPSLSPEEKEELKKNFEMLEEDIKQRKKEKLKCQPSFEEDLEVKSPPLIPPKAAQKSAEKSEQIIPKKEDLKRKSLDTLDEPETKKSAKNDSTKSPYFADSDKTTTQKPKLESNKKRKPKSETEEDPEYIPYSKKVADAKIKQEQEKLSAYLDSKPSITVIPKSKEQPLKGRKTRTKNAITTKAPKPNQQQKLIPDNMQNLENIPNESDAKIKLEQEKLAAILNIKPNVSLPRIPKSKAKSSKRNTPNQIENTSNLAMLHQIEKVLPEVVITADKKQNLENIPNKSATATYKSRATRSRSKSPKVYVSPSFLQSETNKVNQATDNQTQLKRKTSPNPSTSTKSYISSEFLKKKSKTTSIDVKVGQPSPRKLRSKTKLTVPQLDGADDVPKVRRKPKPVNNSDDDFQPVAPKNAVKKLKKIDRQVLSPDVSEKNQSLGVIKKDTINMWIEVYSELEAQWVCVDLFKGKVNCLDTIRKSVAPSTLAYVFAYNSDGTLKDVTPRYCVQWAAVVRKGRVEQSWLDEAIEQYIKTHRTQMDINEDNDLRKIHLDKPLPTTISEYKDHPLYALERHLLKFQAIYPPNALTLGFVRGEPVYARECVHTLHSRDIWLKSARVVKIGEKPYKVVKARPKWDKLNNTVIKDLPLEIFGYWQTQEYEPPTAENGIVPRNAYGNVELFKECMLPKKTVHLNLPGLNKVCKKLGIDCASAVIGFDFHQGACHPLYDGFVVCEEFADVVVDAWNREQEEAERKEQEKYETRVYGNWKKLIKGLLIRERLKLKYNF